MREKWLKGGRERGVSAVFFNLKSKNAVNMYQKKVKMKR